MSVPIYLFTGILESGKTTFLQDTLCDPEFNNGERNLVLLCEDGEVEYDETVLANYQADIVWVKEEAELTYDFLCACDQQYHPDRVLIEFNGMWSVTNFLEVEYPMDWLLVQILTCVDASTFDTYMNNMRSLLYDQLLHSELIVFNRCDDTTSKAYLRGNVKAINKNAQIIYERVDGSVNTLQDEALPFDTSGTSFQVKDDDYGLWYMDTMEHPTAYHDKEVSFRGQVVEIDPVAHIFLIGRPAMVCCAEDITMIGFVVHYEAMEAIKVGDWISLHATMQSEYDDTYGGVVPVLFMKQIEHCEPLVNALVAFS